MRVRSPHPLDRLVVREADMLSMSGVYERVHLGEPLSRQSPAGFALTVTTVPAGRPSAESFDRASTSSTRSLHQRVQALLIRTDTPLIPPPERADCTIVEWRAANLTNRAFCVRRYTFDRASGGPLRTVRRPDWDPHTVSHLMFGCSRGRIGKREDDSTIHATRDGSHLE